MANRHSHERRGSRVALIAMVAGVVVAVMVATRAGDTPPPAVTPSAAAPADRAAPLRERPVPPAEVGALDPAMLSSDALRQALADYQHASVYPPGSHLWTEETAGENQPWNQPFPVEHALDDRPGQETVSRFASDRHHVEFGEALTSTIEVWPAARPGKRLPVVIRSALVEAFGQGRTGVSLTYRDDGEGGDAVAGDHVYTNRFVPSDREELAVAAMRVRLQVDIEAGGVERLLHLDFTYTPRPLLELVAATTGARDGGLGLSLDLEVHDPGAYQFYADVLADDGETAIGWITGHWIDLGPGRQRVDLVLFGKVLHDRGLAGPYVFANLRAVRRSDEREVEAWWSDPRRFRSEAFGLDAFSPDAWDGPERREVIAAIEKSIAEQEEAEGRGR
jgi:hypothetical protein